MSVLIKGMEMPQDGNWITVRIHPDGSCFIPNWQGDCTLIKGAQAVPVPPHGRLIDADALDDAFTDLRWENGDYKSGALMHWGDRPHWCLIGSEIESLINAAPTIIEVEEVYNKYTDTAGNLHWSGTRSGEHTIRTEEGE